MTGGNQRPKIGVVVVAHNASTTLAAVLDRIPDVIWSGADSVLVCDDHSDDETYELALRYQRGRPNCRWWSPVVTPTSATAATGRPPTDGRSTRSWTSWYCCTVMADTHPSAWVT